MNLSSLIRYIDRETFVDCIKSPSQRIIEHLDKDGYWIGMNKRDPFITGIAVRALVAAEKALKSPDLPFRRNRRERSLLDYLADKLEGT